jgi:hypothetical protein
MISGAVTSLSAITEQSQAINDDQHRAPFVKDDGLADPHPSEDGGDDQNGADSQCDEQILTDDVARCPSQLHGEGRLISVSLSSAHT